VAELRLDEDLERVAAGRWDVEWTKVEAMGNSINNS
jgi:hypothetical protein